MKDLEKKEMMTVEGGMDTRLMVVVGPLLTTFIPILVLISILLPSPKASKK